MSALSLITTILGLLQNFIAWGQSRAVFKQDEAVIASEILKKALKDIETSRAIDKDLDTKFSNDPSSVM